MSNKNTSKQNIAEKLFNDKKLSGEEIIWILSHLPDLDTSGKYSTSLFNHENDYLLKAIGVSDKDWDVNMQLFLDQVAEYLQGKFKMSEFVEKIINKNDFNMYKFLCVICIDKLTKDYVNFSNHLTPDQLEKYMRTIQKLRRGK